MFYRELALANGPRLAPSPKSQVGVPHISHLDVGLQVFGSENFKPPLRAAVQNDSISTAPSSPVA